MRKLIFVIMIVMQSCMEPRPDLQVNIINHSKHKIYVGEINGCDSCAVMLDARLYCDTRGMDTTYFPRVIEPGKNAIMQTRVKIVQRIDVINVDTLQDYCKAGSTYDITGKQWVQLISTDVDVKNKKCSFTVNK